MFWNEVPHHGSWNKVCHYAVFIVLWPVD